MRTLIICAAAGLALTACQRPAEDTTETSVATDAAMEATATDATGGSSSGAWTGSTSGSGSSSASGSATAAGDASADTMGTAPVNDGMMSGPSPAVRDTAKEKAEESNLHPRPPQ